VKYVVTLLCNERAPVPAYQVGDPLQVGDQVEVEVDHGQLIQVAYAGMQRLQQDAARRRGRGPTFGDLLVLASADNHQPFGYFRLEDDGVATAVDLNTAADDLFRGQPPAIIQTERGGLRLWGKSPEAGGSYDTPIHLGNTAQARLVALRILAKANAIDAANDTRR
jgi:hypothetical protein